MKILVTGSEGFVGSSFAAKFAAEGNEMLGVDIGSQPSPDWQGSYISADVAFSDLSPMIEDFQPDAILHAAGSASVGASFSAPVDDLRASVHTWANILDSVRRTQVRPVIVFPSSAAVYGNPLRLPVPEDAIISPISPYGYHKSACELIGREYAQCYGLNVLCGRLFSIYGPRQRRLLVWEIFQQLLSGDSVTLQGTGRETRDYLHVEDAASAFLALVKVRLGRSGFLAVNIASGVETSILDLIQCCSAGFGKEVSIETGDHSRPGDPTRWQADTKLLRSLAHGWHSRRLQDGLVETIAAWKAGV